MNVTLKLPANGNSPKTCECGCGAAPKQGNRYVHNHHWRGKTRIQKPSVESNVKRSITLRRYPVGAVCEVEGCDEPRKQRTYCSKHYTRWLRYGDPTFVKAVRRKGPGRGACRIEGCDKPSAPSRTNLCNMHLTRLARTGTTELLSRRIDQPNYYSAHARVRVDRGRAAEQRCVDCSNIAAHWSFQWRDVPIEKWMWSEGSTRKRRCPYTGDPMDYAPRCHSCASRYDRDFAMELAAMLQETRRHQLEGATQ